MARPLTILLCAALTTAVIATPAAPARADVIAQSVAGFEGGPALAGDGRVVIGERRGNGALAVLAIDPVTRGAAPLTGFGPLADPATFSQLFIAGNGGSVTATRRILGTRLQLPFDVRSETVLPAVAAIAACSGPPRVGPFLESAGGDGFVAALRADCGAAAPVVTILSANARRTIPLAPVTGEHTFAPAMFALRAAGPMVGWIETHYPGGLPQSSIVVARAATGVVLTRSVLPGTPFVFWALSSDGTAVYVRGSCDVAVVAPAAPAARVFALAPGSCPVIGADPSPLSVAGGRVVYAASGDGSPSPHHYAMTDLQGAGHALAEITAGPPATPSQTAFDGQTVYLVRVDCDADRLLALDARVAAIIAPANRSRAERCPVRRASPARLRVAADGRVSIGLRCAHGCRGTLRIVQQRRGRRERQIGHVSYNTPAGTVVVRPRVPRYARALAGCAGGLRVAAILHPIGARDGPATSDLGRGLGAYRIVSRTPCQRTGGPPFTSRQKGPRP